MTTNEAIRVLAELVKDMDSILTHSEKLALRQGITALIEKEEQALKREREMRNSLIHYYETKD
jgi:hypothetical protein